MRQVILAALTAFGWVSPLSAGPAADRIADVYRDVAPSLTARTKNLFTGPAARQFSARDRAVANGGEMGCVDFDMSLDAQDYDEDELARTLRLDETVNGDDAIVVAHFDLFGRPTEIEWTMRRVGGEWKVADIASRTNGWRFSEFDCSR
ncbi:MAG: DUF3828 domain-containing protein [Rhizobiaceae bacterium]|nr:DUF3828 domain-containing protein [Rhizobiaceae bacterium]